MTLWTAVHLGVSPTSKTIRDLDEWQIGLIYETAMNFPVDGLRKSYFKRQSSVETVDDDDFLDLGYTMEEIEMIKGLR